MKALADTVVGIDLHRAWKHCRKVLVSDYFGLKPCSFSCQHQELRIHWMAISNHNSRGNVTEQVSALKFLELVTFVVDVLTVVGHDTDRLMLFD